VHEKHHKKKKGNMTCQKSVCNTFNQIQKDAWLTAKTNFNSSDVGKSANQLTTGVV
jgi:hypothetical protein